MKTFLLHIGTFQGWFRFWVFQNIFWNSKFVLFYYIKVWKSQNAPPFCFSRIARDSKIDAREGVKMRHFRAKSQHLDTLGEKHIGTVSCLFVCLYIDCHVSRPTTHSYHEIAGYKVLLQSLLPGSLRSLESVVQVWHIVPLGSLIVRDDRVCLCLATLTMTLFLASGPTNGHQQITCWKESATELIFC